MNLTINNISKEYPKLDQKSLPGPLKKDEFDFVKENLDLYEDDEAAISYLEQRIDEAYANSLSL